MGGGPKDWGEVKQDSEECAKELRAPEKLEREAEGPAIVARRKKASTRRDEEKNPDGPTQ